MASFLSSGKLRDKILAMLAKMKENQGGIYENKDLTKAILENPSTDKYCKEVEKYILKKHTRKYFCLRKCGRQRTLFFRRR